MAMNNARECEFERFEILGRDALFLCGRIDRKTIPDGLYAYDLRDDDDQSGTPRELKDFIMVNHWGTVITREPIPRADKGILLTENDYGYVDGYVDDINDFLRKDD